MIKSGYERGYYIKKKCAYCKKEFYCATHIRGGLRPAGLKKMTDRTCSRKCSRKRIFENKIKYSKQKYVRKT